MDETSGINENATANNERHKAPSMWNIMWKEIYHDKVALVSFFLFIIILVGTYATAFTLDESQAKRVLIGSQNKPPSKEYILGTDPSGRDMFQQVILGAKNSFAISIIVTVICGIIGVVVGLVSGYYGGHTDNVIMRIIDFFMMLPALMIIIVIVSIIPGYSVPQFVAVMCFFLWTGRARLIRTKALQQSNLDYVAASKTLGTPNIVIMFREVFPNISSLVVVNMTLTLAANMGLETGLSFLGFGLPFNTPSLGTLISYASDPSTIQNRLWQWMPASLLIFVMMLCIYFVGQALNRAVDAKQRKV